MEYGLIAALVSVAGITAFGLLGSSVNDVLDFVAGNVLENIPRCVEVESSCKQ